MAWVAGIAASMFVIGIGTILWLAGRINARADDISDFWPRGFLLWKYGGLLLVAMGVGQLVFLAVLAIMGETVEM
jgi:hypothetical protein